ncbi:MAG TPA: methyltransferase domain-containing protein [Candidatus Saccharimonadales bacterium]|nr:methyltransferase domain-containing protein [Candidatus Saccharimonadales bacterium]
MKKRIKAAAKKILGGGKGKVMLNVGCGTDYKKGWVNVDNNSDNNIKQLDLNWDLRNPLPYKDGSVDFIFNEHLIEHLTVEEGQAVLKDLMRVLKPGGVLRIATPNLTEVVEQYASLPIDKDPTIKRFKLTYIKTPAERINIAFREWGHKWLYDTEELKRRIEEAGYTKIKFCKLRESEYPELRNLEIREESNLIAEITK